MAPQTVQKHADGVIGRDDQGRSVLSFERYLKFPIDRVWRAITDPNEVRGWLRGMDIDARVGGAITLRFPGDKMEAGSSAAKGQITAFEPPFLIEYWTNIVNSQNEKARHIMRWQLKEQQDGCLLNFSTTFNLGERASNSIICGWHHCLELLENSLEGRPANWKLFTRDRIEELYWHYRNKQR